MGVGGQQAERQPPATYLDLRRGLFIPPVHRVFSDEALLRTPRKTIEFHHSPLPAYQGSITKTDFYPVNNLNPDNSDLDPTEVELTVDGDSLSINITHYRDRYGQVFPIHKI